MMKLYYGISRDVALSLIKCNKNTITELILSCVEFTDSIHIIVEMPRLKHLYLLLFKKDYEAQIRLLIKAFGRNLTGLWTCDNFRKNYKRKSTEELNNLKMEALA